MGEIGLVPRVDEFSYQVSSRDDPRFWFRLIREGTRDVVTDFFLGEQPREEAGRLLVRCFEAHRLSPRAPLVFRDIVPSPKPDSEMLRQATRTYSLAGRHLLAELGIAAVEEHLEEVSGKLCLTLSVA